MPKPLIPLKDYVAACKDDVWSPREEWFLYRGPLERFKIVHERASSPMGFHDVWRDEMLMDQGIDPHAEDTFEFSRDLLDGPFQHLSPYALKVLISVLQESVTKWETEQDHIIDINRGKP